MIQKHSIKKDKYDTLIQKEEKRINCNMMKSIYATLRMDNRLVSVINKEIYLIVNRTEKLEHYIVIDE